MTPADRMRFVARQVGLWCDVTLTSQQVAALAKEIEGAVRRVTAAKKKMPKAKAMRRAVQGPRIPIPVNQHGRTSRRVGGKR